MNAHRFAVIAASCGMLALVGWVAAGMAGLGSSGIENGGVPLHARPTIAIARDAADVGGISVSDAGMVYAVLPDSRQVREHVPTAPDPVPNNIEASPPRVEDPETGNVGTALSHPLRMLPSAAPPERIASASAPDPRQDGVAAPAPPVEVAAFPDHRETLSPVQVASLFGSAPSEEELKPAGRVLEIPNECLVVEICIDDYLWSFYERTPKVDTNRIIERIKATVKKKGKTRIVTKTFIRYVIGDFTWKDPIAAQRAGMSIKDYVIGGMDRGFKLKLYHALRAMDDAGFMPGITSAFRDDYRQSIASGKTAASDSSYHGGSRRGGYGHGLAADLVSVRGDTRLQRFASSVELWKWIDAHEKELGIGRPYLNRDPPHVGPIDGQEYADKRGGAKARLLKLATIRRAR